MRLSSVVAMAAVLIVGGHTGALAQARQPEQAPALTASQQNRQMIAPVFGTYTDDVLYGDVWKRAGLSPRDRSLVTVSALITLGRTQQLEYHAGYALQNGVTPVQLSGTLTHLAVYAGWPSSVSALEVVVKVFAARGVDTAAVREAYNKAVPLPPAAAIQEDHRRLAGRIAAVAPKLAELTASGMVDDLWRRPELSPRDRSLVTIASLVANGSFEQLPAQLRLGLKNGLTWSELGETFTHLGFYCGWPKATTAAEIAAPLLAAEKARR